MKHANPVEQYSSQELFEFARQKKEIEKLSANSKEHTQMLEALSIIKSTKYVKTVKGHWLEIVQFEETDSAEIVTEFNRNWVSVKTLESVSIHCDSENAQFGTSTVYIQQFDKDEKKLWNAEEFLENWSIATADEFNSIKQFAEQSRNNNRQIINEFLNTHGN
jgi:hypothetical protein